MAEPTDKEPRGATNLRIKFRSANLDEFIERYSVDVSRGGIFIRTREPLSVGSRLKLDFQLLEAGPLLEGEGTVVWIRQPDPARSEVTPGMGVRFDKLTPESQTRLDKILAEKERLSQSGKAPGLTKSTGGMAVRRPTGAFATVDAGAGKAPPSPPPPAPPAAAAAPPAIGPRMTAPLATSQARPSPPASGFGRPRSPTGGMAALRSAPAPSALFEAPTADDIDRALSVLEEKGPGPGPLIPPPPPPTPPPTPRAAADVPIQVADDASNEPTRVVFDPQEFGVHEAVTGKADATALPETGVPELAASAIEDLTAPASADDEATMAASPAAFAAAERAIVGAAPATERKTPASALDAPLAAHLATPPSVPPPSPSQGPSRKKSIIMEPLAPMESGRFRTNATYRRPSKSGKRIAALIVLVVAAGAGLKFRHRLRALLPTSEVATAPRPAPPVPEPSPSVIEEAGANSAAVDATIAAAPEGTAGSSGSTPAAAREEQAKPAIAAGPGPAAPSVENRPKRKRPRAAPAEAPAAASAEKSAGTPAEKSEEKKPAPAEAAAPGADVPAPPSPPETPPAASPTLKITSTPTGAEVIIDGSTVGNTPFSSKDFDSAVTHAIAVKKDGYETNVRTVGASDWAHPKSGPLLKMNVKLRRNAGAGPETPREPAEPKKPDVEIITPD